MRIRIVAVGKIREAYVRDAIADFSQRLKRNSIVGVFEVAASHGGDPARAMREEAERILRAIDPSERVWLLERTGSELSSVELAKKLDDLVMHGVEHLAIVIAGTFGADPMLVERADFCWSLSKLTFLHEWARAILLEQLYRAAKIARDEPYHH